MRRLLPVGLAAILLLCSSRLVAQPETPTARLVRATPATFTGPADSNSPALWQLVAGQDLFYLVTSIDGRPSTAVGRSLTTLGPTTPANIDPWPGGGVWIEAVVEDADGTWYGYYHNENIATFCPHNTTKVTPRVGAVRSHDRGATWEPLGIVLDAPVNTSACNTKNEYFVGGVGDFSVMLDPDSRDLYFFVSQYYRSAAQQGVGVARLAWADRDDPVGKAMVWQTRTWLPAARAVVTDDTTSYVYRAATPLFPTTQPWHDRNPAVDAFWGPSVHYNTYLKQYVMLLNRAKNEKFDEEGIYISYSPRLDDPGAWTPPVKILNGGSWYPQVVGLENGGTDKLAGETARFFMAGRSDYLIQFSR